MQLPKALKVNSHRLPGKAPFWHGKRKAFTKAVISTGLILILLFFGDLLYVYGSLYGADTSIDAFSVLYVDFDGGVIGRSVDAAYQQLKGPTFPTLHTGSPAQYPDVAAVKHAVCKEGYWAAVFTAEGASDRLASALYGSSGASVYDPKNAVIYVWDEVRYPAVADGEISSNLQLLISTSRVTYNSINGSSVLQSFNANDALAQQTILNPISPADINLHPTGQGPRVLYNTISMVMPIIQCFFLMMGLNGISLEFQFYSKLSVRHNALIRFIAATTFTMLAGLTMTGYIWALREHWYVDANQFVLTWMILWLYMHIQFCLVDILTAWVRLAFLPYAIITWVLVNVASTIYPLETAPGFYNWSYALPAHELYQVLVVIWSGGCHDRQLRHALPVLFAWGIFGLAGAVISLWRHCAHAEEEARNHDREILSEAEKLAAGTHTQASNEALIEKMKRDANVTVDPMQYGYHIGVPPPV